MQLPALQIKQPNVANALLSAERIKGSQTRNRLLEAKMKRDQELDALTGQAMQDLGSPKRNALAGVAADPDIGTDPGAMGEQPGRAAETGIPQSVFRLPPDRAKMILDIYKTKNDEQKAAVKKQTEGAARLAIGVLDAPPDRQEGAYMQALQIAQNRGMDTSALPPTWGPDAAQALTVRVREAQAFDDLMKSREAPTGFARTGTGMEPVAGGPADPNYLRKKAEATRAPEEVDKFEPVVDDSGRIVAQRNVRTGEVKADPRKPTDEKSPTVFDYYDEGTGRKRKGYMKDGKVVPVGGVAAADADGKDPARVKEANWLVENGIFPNLKAAYDATRTRVTSSPADVRAKGLSWMSTQKDRLGRQVYDSPEKQAAALSAYEKFVAGDTQGALAALKALEPPEVVEEPGWIERKAKELFGAVGESKPKIGAKSKPPKMHKGPDGKEYPEATDQAAYDALPPGSTYWHPVKKQFLTKGQ